MSTSDSALPRRSPAHIDPRIRARRIEVQRGIGRRRLQRLVDLGLLLAVAAGFGVALRSPLLDVDGVEVAGAEQTAPELVLEQAGIGRGEQLMDVDLQAAGARVAELPWVDEVTVHRRLDGVIELALTERTAVAVVGEGDGAVLVDAEGRALARATERPELAAAVVQVSGVPAAVAPGEYLPARAADALAVAARLADTTGLGLALEVGDELVGTLASGIEVRFGAATQLDAKVRSLRTVLEQVDLACADVIDVRAPGSPVLTREETCS